MIKKYKKQIIFLMLSLLGIIFIYISREEIRKIFDATSDTKLRWLFAAIFLQLIVYFFLASAHRSGLKLVGVERTRKELIPLILAALVVNSTAPSGGTSGTILFINDSKKRGESGTKTGTAIILVIVLNFVALLAILSGCLVYLRALNELGTTEIISTAILFFVVLFIYSILFFAKIKPAMVEKFFLKLSIMFENIKAFFKIKSRKSHAWVKVFTEELHSASKSVHGNGKGVLNVILMFLFAHFFNFLTIYILFISFSVHTKIGIIIAGYAIGELFKIVSPSPEGIGVTEASMVIVYSSFGVNPLIATSITLIYRGLNFWIPFGLGFFFLQKDNLKST